MPPIKPVVPAAGQESVWDYPRPPRLEDTTRHIEIVFGGVTIADTRRAKRVLETSHPPGYYLPPEDIRMEYLRPLPQRSMCEWKGQAAYYTVAVGQKVAEAVAWYYPEPIAPYESMASYVAFYAGRMDACYIDGELVVPQPGDFYGGWITADVVGPFKGIPGSWGW